MHYCRQSIQLNLILICIFVHVNCVDVDQYHNWIWNRIKHAPISHITPLLITIQTTKFTLHLKTNN